MVYSFSFSQRNLAPDSFSFILSWSGVRVGSFLSVLVVAIFSADFFDVDVGGDAGAGAGAFLTGAGASEVLLLSRSYTKEEKKSECVSN